MHYYPRPLVKSYQYLLMKGTTKECDLNYRHKWEKRQWEKGRLEEEVKEKEEKGVRRRDACECQGNIPGD